VISVLRIILTMNGAKLAIINLTNQCNLNCPHCFDNDKSRDIAQELDKQILFRVMRELKEIGVTNVNFSGGEPTLRQDIVELINYANDLDLYVSVATNGMFDWSMRNSLFCSRVNTLQFSLDASSELNNEIRGSGSFEMCVENIKIAVRSDKNIRIQSIIMSKNLGVLPEHVEYTKALGVKSISFQPYFALNPAKEYWIDNLDLLDRTMDKLIEQTEGFIVNSKDNLESMKAYFRTPSLRAMGMTCPAGSYFGINWDGRVMPCWGLDWDVGNVKEKSLMEIFKNTEIWDERKGRCDRPCLLMCYEKSR